MDEEFPSGALITVKLEIRVPIASTRSQINEWLNYNCLQSGGIGLDNPLYNKEPDAFGPRPLAFEYSGMVGRREEFDHENRPDGRYYKVRWIRERAPPKP